MVTNHRTLQFTISLVCPRCDPSLPLVCPILWCLNVIIELSILPTLLADSLAYWPKSWLNNPMMATSRVILPFSLLRHITPPMTGIYLAAAGTASRNPYS